MAQDRDRARGLEGYRVNTQRTPIPAFGPHHPLEAATLRIFSAAGDSVGVGFLITHQAIAGDYLIAGWWDNVNELPMRTFVSQPGAADFCPSNERQSICIWDVDVVTAERDAFVAAFGEDGLDKETYLNDFRAASRKQSVAPADEDGARKGGKVIAKLFDAAVRQ